MSVQSDVLWDYAVRLRKAAKDEPDLEKAGELVLQSVKWFDKWSDAINGKKVDA
jgi:hypothetical protein